MKLLTLVFICGCASAVAAELQQPLIVKVESQGTGWQLTRNGEPYLIRGVGGDKQLAALKAAGGNSIRTWSAEKLEPILDEAYKQGLTVTVGLWLGHERHGFDYNNADQVASQAEAVRQTITQFKDHPAVLMWGLGNEMEGYAAGDNAAIWSAINNLAVLAKQLDPHHPTMTVVAEIGGDRVSKDFWDFCFQTEQVWHTHILRPAAAGGGLVLHVRQIGRAHV